MENVQRCAVEAAVEAVAHAFEAKFGYGSGFCGKEQGIGGNRHDPEKYAQDPEVQILAIADETDTVRGILTGYALHPTVLPTDTTLASTDYVGYLRRTVEQAYPGAVFGLCRVAPEISRAATTGMSRAIARRSALEAPSAVKPSGY